MERFPPNTPHPNDLTRRVKVFPAIQKRKKSKANIWFFDSPKNQKRFVITGDLPFMSFILLEGDQTVNYYNPFPGAVIVNNNGKPTELIAGAHVFYVDGQFEWWDFEYGGKKSSSNHQGSLSKLAADMNGMKYHIQTAKNVQNKQVLFDNWLTICAGINRCRSIILHRELECILKETQDSEITF